MLKTLWNKAVYGAQYLNQMRDGNAVKICDNEIANARDGFRLQVIGHTHGVHTVKVPLTPQQAQEVIQRNTIRKIEVERAMEKRRTTYGLTF